LRRSEAGCHHWRQEKHSKRCCDHSSDDNAREGLLSLCADPIGDSGWQQAQTGGKAGHQDGAKFVKGSGLQSVWPRKLALHTPNS
jgi:hypothetical protein